jgi:hypothetical protein
MSISAPLVLLIIFLCTSTLGSLRLSCPLGLVTEDTHLLNAGKIWFDRSTVCAEVGIINQKNSYITAVLPKKTPATSRCFLWSG